MASMRKIAEVAGVSVSTVSAVFSGAKFVSPALARRVTTAAGQLGYNPQGRKRGAPVRQTREVAVILPGIYSAFFPPLLSGIEDAASEFGYSVILCDSERSLKKESELLDEFARRGVKNIILDSICDVKHEQEYFDRLKKQFVQSRGMNLVVLEREMKDDAFHSIYVDNYRASYEMTCHLIERGHTKIAHIGGHKLFPHAHVRAEAFRAALLDHDVPFDEHLMLQGDFSPLSGYAAVNEMNGKGLRATAIFCANDQMAIGAMKAIHETGLCVPDDIAVAGFDNLTVASLVSPGLTTVQYPIYQMGFRAMRIIVDRMQGLEREKRNQLDARLIIRRSTDPTQTDDWNLQRW